MYVHIYQHTVITYKYINQHTVNTCEHINQQTLLMYESINQHTVIMYVCMYKSSHLIMHEYINEYTVFTYEFINTLSNWQQGIFLYALSHRQDSRAPAMGHQIDSSWCFTSVNYFSFQPLLHNLYNKGWYMYYPVYRMTHIKYPRLLIEKSSP